MESAAASWTATTNGGAATGAAPAGETAGTWFHRPGAASLTNRPAMVNTLSMALGTEEASAADGGGGIDRDHPSLVADADPEAGLAPTQGPSDHDANDNKATTKSGTVSLRASSWRQLAAAARSHLLLDTSDKEAGGWTGPLGERRSEEQVYRAQLCLIDAGEKQRPTLARGPPGKETAPMRWYHLRRKPAYLWFVRLACLLYLCISLFETPDFRVLEPLASQDRGGAKPKDWVALTEQRLGKVWYELLIEIVCVMAFAADLRIQALGSGAWTTLRSRWTQLFIVFLLFDVVGMIWPVLRVLMVTGVVRCYPIVYYNAKARNSFLNYLRTLPSVLQWIASEFFLIVVYACACVLLYSDADSTGRSGQVPFLTFEKAFISLYSLSLTVNDPDVYLPYYRMWSGNVFVFLSFLVLTFFMIHNIILARIFQIYATKLKETALRRQRHRQEALWQAFDALDDEGTGRLSRELVAHVLQRLKPKYSQTKIHALMYKAMVSDGEDTKDYDLDQFVGLMTSVVDDDLHRIRPPFAHSAPLQRALDLMAVAEFALVVVAVARFKHVFYSIWVWWVLLSIRILFTLDLAYRASRYPSVFIFLRNWHHKASAATLLLALAAGACLLYAVYAEGEPGVLNVGGTPESRTPSQRAAGVLVLLVATLDVCGVTARLPEYAALLKVVARLFLPAFLGQAIVVFTLLHVFTYIGMFCFGGRVSPSQAIWATKTFPNNLYYLLNFNTYLEGMITLTMLMAGNNFNVISGNFVQVMRNEGVYVYFITFQVLVTVVALSCVTSFFITHLSSRLEEELERQEWARTLRRERTKRQRRQQNAGGGEASDTEDPPRRRWGLFARRRSRHEPTADDGDDSLGPRAPPSMARPPSTPPPQHYHLERRLSSGFLVLAEDEPVDAAEYRCLLDAMSKETGDRTAYCFVKERPKGQPPEVILKSSLFSKILGPYTGEARIHHVCARVFARERSRRKRGLAAIVGSSTLVDISISAATAAAAAAAAATEGSASASGGGGRGVGGEGDKEKGKEGEGRGGRETVEEQLFKNSSLGPRAGPVRGTYFCLEERHAHPTRAGQRQLFLKFYIILEREFMLAYVHVEEEVVVVGMMGSRARSGAERGMNRSVMGKSSFFDWIDD